MLLITWGISAGLAHRLRTDALVVWCAGFLALMLAAVLFAPMLPLREGVNPVDALDQPILAGANFFSAHPLGTDDQGLDILSRLLYGGRVSLTVAFGGVLIGAVVGSLLGIISGYSRGWVDRIVSAITDILLAFPALILLLALAAALEATVTTITIALGVLAVPGFIRLARANTRKIMGREFVTSAILLGSRPSRVLVRDVLPNVVPSLVAYSLVVVSYLVLAEASLSYLGLGVDAPTWGRVIAAGEPLLRDSPHLVFGASAVLFLTIMSVNLVGQRLQEKWSLE